MDGLKASKKRIIGLKQTIRAIKENKVRKVYVAKDADDHIKNNILKESNGKDIEIIYVNTMKELGEACGIEVKASTASLLKD
ncbi:MAG: 50S ribosomal protein L7ae-like protein [Clostridiales bacterium]|nr:50S ribosomal protein L7ae-like protein [Clostridiales bacterium]